MIELLVVIALISMLAALLLSTVGKAKERARMTQCLGNLHQVGMGLAAYIADNQQTYPPAYEAQLNPSLVGSGLEHGDFLGGIDGMRGVNYPLEVPPARNRLLTPYVRASDAFHCPSDRGYNDTPPSRFYSWGCSYRLNHSLPSGYQHNANLAEDPLYNLGQKKESWPPDPSRFVAIHEWAGYPWFVEDFYPTVLVTQWHYASRSPEAFDPATLAPGRNQLIAPVLFADGHSKQCDFTEPILKNPKRGLEPTKDWVWYKPRQ